MATEWYLLESKHDQLSGYESDALYDFAEDGFEEVLDSAIAIPVELYNYDLSECKSVKAVIQNNVQDTKLKTLTRQMLVPIGTCYAGMYVKYKNRFWIITGLVDDNTMYEKAVLSLCNWLLTWVNDKGKIIQRWANVTSASQYNNGETGMQYYFVRSDQLMVILPDDDESILIPDGKRFIIDRRCNIYEKSFTDDIIKDLSHKVASYQLTRSDSVLYNYGTNGHMAFMATQDEQHDNDGYYVIDGKGYWLCEPPSNSIDKTGLLSCEIGYEDNVIYNGLEPTIFTASFTDSEGNSIDIEPQWKIKCDFLNKLNVVKSDNFISISTNNSKLINKSFELFLSADGYEPKQLTVYIRAFF